MPHPHNIHIPFGISITIFYTKRQILQAYSYAHSLKSQQNQCLCKNIIHPILLTQNHITPEIRGYRRGVSGIIYFLSKLSFYLTTQNTLRLSSSELEHHKLPHPIHNKTPACAHPH